MGKRGMRLVAIALVLMIVMSGCTAGDRGNDAADASAAAADEHADPGAAAAERVSQADDNSLSGILAGIQEDFDATIQYLQDELDKVYEATGDTYEGYVANKQSLSDWYGAVIEESTALYERTRVSEAAYYKLVAETVDHGDRDAMGDALDGFYDSVYDDMMDDYYDDIYDDLMDDVYDAYYDGILDDAYDTVDYSEWSTARSECYREWSDSRSAIYRLWSDTRSGYYRDWSEMRHGFIWSDNYDVDAILAAVEQEREEAGEAETSEPSEPAVEETPAEAVQTDVPEEAVQTDSPAEAVSDDTIRPEIKEAIDSYEAFFDEYAQFMASYDSSDLSALTGYLSMMEQYNDTMQKLDALEDADLTSAELTYYTQAMTRIDQKLLGTLGEMSG